MRPQANPSESIAPESELHNVYGVVVYARKDEHGKPTTLDAIDADEWKIRVIADLLQERGYGVMRQRAPRAGKVFYLFKATWVGQGLPPDDPFANIRFAR